MSLFVCLSLFWCLLSVVVYCPWIFFRRKTTELRHWTTKAYFYQARARCPTRRFENNPVVFASSFPPLFPHWICECATTDATGCWFLASSPTLTLCLFFWCFKAKTSKHRFRVRWERSVRKAVQSWAGRRTNDRRTWVDEISWKLGYGDFLLVFFQLHASIYTLVLDKWRTNVYRRSNQIGPVVTN